MPELPEVETTRKGITAYVVGERIKQVVVRENRLRWPVPKQLSRQLEGQTIRRLWRRGKYLIFDLEGCSLLFHLGMSGSMRILFDQQEPDKHDHIDITFENNHCLRFHDPRRFGSVHITNKPPLEHALLSQLGPEPLSDNLDADYLYARSRNRRQSIKSFIMDSRTVVGIGNIYANEALYQAGIHPCRPAGRISRQRYEKLVAAIRAVLLRAITKGGTTLRDFVNGHGEAGYFRHELQVYKRAGLPCGRCQNQIKSLRIGQRSTYYCSACQR